MKINYPFRFYIFLYLCRLNKPFLAMKKFYITLIILLAAHVVRAESIFNESFEYANHDGEIPAGWACDDSSWLCGFQEKDHNRKPHSGSWYAYTNAEEAWMFMPIYFSNLVQYRCSYWAISDGSYDVELWAGTQASEGDMVQLLYTATINSGVYEKFAEYISDINGSYDYLGIRAVAHDGAYHLTIDDINVDMIVQYSFHASPAQFDTILQPGANVNFNCKVTNTGFESLTIYITPHSEYFTDIHFYVNDEMTNQFPIVQDETVPIRGTATLKPDVVPGNSCWFDVMFEIDCGCATAMFTYWATVVSDGINENYTGTSIYPNPSTGNVTIEGDGNIMVFNTKGQMILTKEIIGKETITLEKGIYYIKKNGDYTEKLIVE